MWTWGYSNFNCEHNYTTLSDFYEIENLKNLIKYKTCLKNPSKLNCIDPIIANRPTNLQNIIIIETEFKQNVHYSKENYYGMQKPSIIYYHKFNDLLMIFYNRYRDTYIKMI